MNKRQTRIFAIASTAIATLIFLVLTVDSHRQFPTLTNADTITEEVVRGQNVWHAYNCINCHTIFGEGAYYAPDLTKITQLRGVPYLTAFMKDPSQFYDEERHRRLMPNLGMSDQEIADVIAFMDWVSRVDNQGWPPRPILVAGSAIPGGDLTIGQQAVEGVEQATGMAPGARPIAADNDPIALGEALFRTASADMSGLSQYRAGRQPGRPFARRSGISLRTDSSVRRIQRRGDHGRRVHP